MAQWVHASCAHMLRCEWCHSQAQKTDDGCLAAHSMFQRRFAGLFSGVVAIAAMVVDWARACAAKV